MESILEENSAAVATTIAGYVAKKLIKRSKCKRCKILLRARGVDIANDEYLNILPRGGLLLPSKSLADFV